MVLFGEGGGSGGDGGFVGYIPSPQEGTWGGYIMPYSVVPGRNRVCGDGFKTLNQALGLHMLDPHSLFSLGGPFIPPVESVIKVVATLGFVTWC